MLLQNLIKNSSSKQLQYARMLNGQTPLFSQFGQNVYASDIVQDCIDIIATEISKLRPRHIVRDENDLIQPLKKGDNLNRLFKFKPNEIMTTKEFLEKIIWLLFLNCNAFIYPTYDIITDKRGNKSKYYTGFYPLNPIQVDFMQDEANVLFLRLYFKNGEHYILPYSDIIHLRKKFSLNDVMGGGLNGQPDNAALLKVLETNDIVMQNIGKAIKTTLSVRGIYKMTSVMDSKKIDAERDHFEQQLDKGNSAVLPIDFKGDYVPIQVNPAIIDKDTMQFLKDTVLQWYGVSLPIITGDYNDDQYQAFYNKTLEPVVIGLGQAFSSCLFTQREQDVGNEIVFYQNKLELMDVKNKLAIADVLGNRGAMTNNQLLALFGQEPYEGGNKRFASLNFINADIIDDYQILRASKGKDSEPTENAQTGKGGE